MFKRSASGETLLVKDTARQTTSPHAPKKRFTRNTLHRIARRTRGVQRSSLSIASLPSISPLAPVVQSPRPCRPVASKKTAHLETVAHQGLAGQGTAPPPSSCRASKRPSCLPAVSTAYTLPCVGHGGAAGCTRNCRTRYRIKLRPSLTKPQSGLLRHAPFLSIVRFGWCARARRGSRPPQRQGPNTGGFCRSPSSF